MAGFKLRHYRTGRFQIALAGFPIFKTYRSHLRAAKGAQALALRVSEKYRTTVEIRDFVNAN